jgi:chemotaxis response regulator CheB
MRYGRGISDVDQIVVALPGYVGTESGARVGVNHHGGVMHTALIRADAPPRPALIVMAVSAGGFMPMLDILAALPPDLDAAIVVVVHRTSQRPFQLDQVIGRESRWPVAWVRSGMPIVPGTIYLVPHDLHGSVAPDRTFRLLNGRRVRGVLSSANPLLVSAAEVFGSRLGAVVLSGADSDGTDGVQSARRYGGHVIVQDPATAAHPSMPQHAIATGAVDEVLPADEIAAAIARFTGVRR